MSTLEKVNVVRDTLANLRKLNPDLSCPLRGVHVTGKKREVLLQLLWLGRLLGLKVSALCSILQISRQRYYYWHDHLLSIPESCECRRPKRPSNALTPDQEHRLLALVCGLAKRGRKSDRAMVQTIQRKLGFRVSHVTVWRYRKRVQNGQLTPLPSRSP